MFGSQPSHEQRCNKKACNVKRKHAFLSAFTMIEILFVIAYMSIFSLSVYKILPAQDTHVLEEIVVYKKQLETVKYTCTSGTVFFKGYKEVGLGCRQFLSYTRFTYKGYIFYHVKGL